MPEDPERIRERLREAEERLEQLEEQNGELLDRLAITETALSSACEARDAAVRTLDEIRRALAGSTAGVGGADLVAAVRRLRGAPR